MKILTDLEELIAKHDSTAGRQILADLKSLFVRHKQAAIAAESHTDHAPIVEPAPVAVSPVETPVVSPAGEVASPAAPVQG